MNPHLVTRLHAKLDRRVVVSLAYGVIGGVVAGVVLWGFEVL
jgi:uncharacterized membrane protein YagU involved in acid resistance